MYGNRFHIKNCTLHLPNFSIHNILYFCHTILFLADQDFEKYDINVEIVSTKMSDVSIMDYVRIIPGYDHYKYCVRIYWQFNRAMSGYRCLNIIYIHTDTHTDGHTHCENN
jgi:hypothetical protein